MVTFPLMVVLVQQSQGLLKEAFQPLTFNKYLFLLNSILTPVFSLSGQIIYYPQFNFLNGYN